MRTSDWLPDWRDPDAYPGPNDLSLREWAWEFLRRSPDYQEDYVRWLRAQPYLTTPGAESDLIEAPATAIADCDPPPEEGETLKAYVERIKSAGGEPKVETLNDVMKKRYGLWEGLMASPDGADSPRLGPALLLLGVSVPRICEGGAHRYARDPQYFLAAFDLQKPFGPQVESMRELFDNEREKFVADAGSRRNQRRLWPTYLRILDAGETKDDHIAATIMPWESNSYSQGCPASKKVRASRKAAIDLRDGGYRWLIYREFAPKK